MGVWLLETVIILLLVYWKYVKKIVQNVAKYANIYDTSDNTLLATYNVGNYISRTTTGVSKALEEIGIKPIIIEYGDYIVSQSLSPKTTILVGEKIFLLTNGGNYQMPDMKDWSRNDVIKYFEMINMKYNITGEGYVTSQNIKVGTIIDSNSEITIEFKNKY